MYGEYFTCMVDGGRALTHTIILYKVESTVFHISNSSSLTDCLQPLSHRRSVAFLSYLLANCMSSLPQQPWCPKLSSFSPLYSVHLINIRVNQCSQSLIHSSGKLKNFLSPILYFHLPMTRTYLIKSKVSRHLSHTSNQLFWLYSETGISVCPFLSIFVDIGWLLSYIKNKNRFTTSSYIISVSFFLYSIFIFH